MADERDAGASSESRPTNPVREALDASDVAGLRHNPGDQDAKLDVALDETFPTSDAPSHTQPGKGKDPAPSSGYDEEAEKARLQERD
jgi:hypothetical protein